MLTILEIHNEVYIVMAMNIYIFFHESLNLESLKLNYTS